MLPRLRWVGLLVISTLFLWPPLIRPQDDKQMDDKSRREVDHLRAIASAIKACPRVEEWKDKGFGTIYDGPPLNVVWDVKPSDSVRAPYFGYVEFFLPREFSATKEECAKTRACADIISATKPFRYRFEFDLGPDGLELTKLLGKLASDKRWSDIPPDSKCWQRAAHVGEKEDEQQ